MTFRTVPLLCAILLLSACGPDNQPPPKIFKDQREALDKAKAVDSVVQKQYEEQQKAIEEQSQ